MSSPIKPNILEMSEAELMEFIRKTRATRASFDYSEKKKSKNQTTVAQFAKRSGLSKDEVKDVILELTKEKKDAGNE